MTILDETCASTADPVDLFVGARLRELRHAAGLSQTALGDRLGVSFQQVQKYERGANRVSASMLVHAAKALGVAPCAVFEGLPDQVAARGGSDHLKVWLASPAGQAWSRAGFAIGAGHRFDAALTVARVIAAG